MLVSVCGCGIGSDVHEDLARAVGPSTIDAGMLLARDDLVRVFRAMHALPASLEDETLATNTGYVFSDPDPQGWRTWQLRYERFTDDPEPDELEGAARTIGAGTFEVTFLERGDDDVTGTFTVTRVDANHNQWIGTGQIDGPGAAATDHASGAPDPFFVISPPVTPSVFGDSEYSGRLTVAVAYFGDTLSGEESFDDGVGFVNVVRNGVADPGGVVGDR